MNLVLITLTAPDGVITATEIDAQMLTDILWANVVAGDRIEHISVQAGMCQNSYTAALFLLPACPGRHVSGKALAETAARVCRTAIATSPTLNGWTASADLVGLLSGD
ncbi:hypothetical protein [Catenulispora subtropica]|uniref:Uncharacterized protein n=1 Tax=Catenulispora subtropica TaxID=450798 RepID=A0ABP5CZK0_9ACTN